MAQHGSTGRNARKSRTVREVEPVAALPVPAAMPAGDSPAATTELGCCGGTSGGTSATSGGATGTSGAGGTSAGGEFFQVVFFVCVTRHDICDVALRTGPSVRPSLATIPAAIATRCPLRAGLNRGSLLWLRP